MDHGKPEAMRALGEAYLMRRWEQFNREFFQGSLSGAVLRMDSVHKRYSGLYRKLPGKISEIRVNSALMSYVDAQMQLDNTLLHEMVHQYVEEVEGGDEWTHGPKFYMVANRIGAELNLPFCAQDRLGDWPDHVEAMLVDWRQGVRGRQARDAGRLSQAPAAFPLAVLKAFPALTRLAQRLFMGTP
jgi:SprT-like family